MAARPRVLETLVCHLPIALADFLPRMLSPLLPISSRLSFQSPGSSFQSSPLSQLHPFHNHSYVPSTNRVASQLATQQRPLATQQAASPVAPLAAPQEEHPTTLVVTRRALRTRLGCRWMLRTSWQVVEDSVLWRSIVL